MNLRSDFGEDFFWGVSSSAFQTEGYNQADGKGPSIWDKFLEQKKLQKKDDSNGQATEFYSRYQEDIDHIKSLGAKNFHFSISWSRIIPQGTGEINKEGIAYYNKLIDYCLAQGIEPWLTLYHWDLPAELEAQGGWTNREIINWFLAYVEVCLEHFADRVRYWLILNEPAAFIGLGYFLGIHAPGKRGLTNFLPAAHHACLCQSKAARKIKSYRSDLIVGTTYSFSPVEPYRPKNKSKQAAERVDALLNRFFLEPMLGLGYPTDKLPKLKKIENYFLPGDEKELACSIDFIGVQNYSRAVISPSCFTPYLRAKLIPAKKRGKRDTAMNWEYYPEALTLVLEWLNEYPNIPDLVVTETGLALEEKPNRNGEVNDNQRIEFIERSLNAIKNSRQAKQKLKGIFFWSLTDNFEWAEGTRPRFGLIHVNYQNQKRTAKASYYWLKKMLQ